MRSRLASKWLEFVDYGIGVLWVVELEFRCHTCGVQHSPKKGSYMVHSYFW
jgi:hypothetical protein